MADAEKMARRTKGARELQWYFKGYRDAVNVFLEEFWDRIQRKYGWNAPPSQSVSRDKNAYLSEDTVLYPSPMQMRRSSNLTVRKLRLSLTHHSRLTT